MGTDATPGTLFLLGHKTATRDDSGDLILEGWASTWATDRDGEHFASSAFDASLERFLRLNPLALWNHDHSKPLGQVIEATVDKLRGLRVKLRIDAPAPGSWAVDVVRRIAKGSVRGLSVGGRFKRSGRTITSADLMEISVCPLPANPEALATVTTPTSRYAASGKAFSAPSGRPDDRTLRALSARMDLVATHLAIADFELRGRGR